MIIVAIWVVALIVLGISDFRHQRNNARKVRLMNQAADRAALRVDGFIPMVDETWLDYDRAEAESMGVLWS